MIAYIITIDHTFRSITALIEWEWILEKTLSVNVINILKLEPLFQKNQKSLFTESQVKKLLNKVVLRESCFYRKLTDTSKEEENHEESVSLQEDMLGMLE